ncbi:hypothetical protein M413DRAFT_446999 [Hebeloma cylindrosporum]|uniref:Uncharacterized protein n=1 Tax=Hebeloma cylindrosporum TaxID=76867 RepID=A0A0C2XPD6_HEBCY|nr:hypothetical protein M413DRAFT_446999 [Hebeloma cylindrosporum h7]
MLHSTVLSVRCGCEFSGHSASGGTKLWSGANVTYLKKLRQVVPGQKSYVQAES